MTTEIAAQTNQQIRCYGQSLAPQARSEHRAWIGVRVRALLSNYWVQTPDEATLSLIFADWIDTLDHFTGDEINKACRDWVRREPRRRPNFGDISGLIVARRAQKRAAMKPEPQPERERMSADRASEILAEVGFNPKRMGAEK